jgi:enoyl-CoA hydratase/carnithine racemase
MVEENFEHIKIEYPKTMEGGTVDGNYAIISMNRPDKLNALQVQTLKEIATALDTMDLDPNIRCVLLRGTKDFTKKPAFSAGADLSATMGKNVKPNVPIHMMQSQEYRHKYYDQIERFLKPLIAGVDGFALGGGLELTLVCDVVIASKRSKFGFPEIARGIFPSNGGTQRMVQHIGAARVFNMMYFGEHYSAEKMHEWGFVSHIVDDDKFEDYLHEKMKWLGEAATGSLAIIKKCIRYGTQVPLNVGLQFEQMGFGINSAAKDIREGISAFLQKREPKFKGF